MKNLYCMLLNEQHIKLILADAFAEIGCNASPDGTYVIYKYQLQSEGDRMFLECILSIAQDDCFDEENEIELSDGQSLDGLIAQYKNENKNCIYYRIDDKIMSHLICDELRCRRIQKLSKKAKDRACACFFGSTDEDLKCLVVFGIANLDKEAGELLSERLTCQTDIDKLCVSKFARCKVMRSGR